MSKDDLCKTNFLYLFTFYLLSQLVKIKTWELRPILELSPILELKPPSDVEIFIKARALITVNTVSRIVNLMKVCQTYNKGMPNL